MSSNIPIFINTLVRGSKETIVRLLNAVIANLHEEGERILLDDDIDTINRKLIDPSDGYKWCISTYDLLDEEAEEHPYFQEKIQSIEAERERLQCRLEELQSTSIQVPDCETEEEYFAFLEAHPEIDAMEAEEYELTEALSKCGRIIRQIDIIEVSEPADGELCIAFELYVSEGDDQYTDWPAWSDIEHFYNCKVQVN